MAHSQSRAKRKYPRCVCPAPAPRFTKALARQRYKFTNSTTPLTSKAAYTEVLVCPGGYSSSASARAVRLLGDQFTGFLPRKMCPSVNILPNTCSTAPPPPPPRSGSRRAEARGGAGRGGPGGMPSGQGSVQAGVPTEGTHMNT